MWPMGHGVNEGFSVLLMLIKVASPDPTSLYDQKSKQLFRVEVDLFQSWVWVELISKPIIYSYKRPSQKTTLHTRSDYIQKKKRERERVKELSQQAAAGCAYQ